MVGVRDNKNNLQNVQKRHLNINSQIQVPFSNYTFFIGDISNLFLAMQIATFCGQQGRIPRTVRAILSGQF